jgi:hypothetical protein
MKFQFAGCGIIFFDAGTYLISNTLLIPPGAQVVGEAWSQIMIGGSQYQNINAPHVGVQVGTAGQTGVVEISGIVFTTRGPGQSNTKMKILCIDNSVTPAPGAIVVEWNIGQSSLGSAGTWDTFMR